MSRFVSATRGTCITEFAVRYQDALLLALTLEWGAPERARDAAYCEDVPGHSRLLWYARWPGGRRQLEKRAMQEAVDQSGEWRILRLTARDTDRPLIAALQDQFPGRKRAAGRRP